jgi:hypothetical protein
MLAIKFLQLRCRVGNTARLNPQLHCTDSLSWTRSVESYSLGVHPKRTPLAPPLLLLRDVTAYLLTQSLHSNGCMRHVSWRLFYCCVRALPSNGCFSASTILALSKYATISWAFIFVLAFLLTPYMCYILVICKYSYNVTGTPYEYWVS